MAGRHVANGNSGAKARKGRHRKARVRRTEHYVWLGAGAVTLGVGAALASGSGVANADTGGADDGASSATSTAGPAASTTPSDGGESSQGSDAGGPVTAPATSLSATGGEGTKTPIESAEPDDMPGRDDDSPRTSFSFSGGALTSERAKLDTEEPADDEKVAAEEADIAESVAVEPTDPVVAQPFTAEQEVQLQPDAYEPPAETNRTSANFVTTSLAADETEDSPAAAEAPGEPTLSGIVDLAGNPLYITTTKDGRLTFVLEGIATPEGVPGVGLVQIDEETGVRATTIVATSQPIGMATTPDGRYVYIGRAENVGGVVVQTVVVYDSQTKSIVGDPITVAGSYPQPGHFSASADGKYVYVTAANIEAGSMTGVISVIDTSTNTVTKTIKINQLVTYTGMNPAGDRLYVAGYGMNATQTGVKNTVTVINTKTNAVERTIDVTAAGYPAEVVVSPDNKRLYILSPSTAPGNPNGVNLVAVNAETGGVLWKMEDVGQIAGGFGQRGRFMQLSPDGQRLYLRSTEIKVIDIKTRTFVGDPVVLSGVISGHYDMGLSADGKTLYLAVTGGELGNEGQLMTFNTNYVDGSGEPPRAGGGGLSVIGYQAAQFANELIRFAVQFQRVSADLASQAFQLAYDVISFGVTAYGEYAKSLNARSKAFFDAANAATKQALIGTYAAAVDFVGEDIVSQPYRILQTTMRVVTPVLRAAAPILTAFAIAQAYEASQSAQTAMEEVHAGIQTAAAWAPLAGATIGFVIGGPVGAGMGLLVGGAFGLGLTIGSVITGG